MSMFRLFKKDRYTQARRGEVKTFHGTIQSPFFMPVGTIGVVKSLIPEDLHQMDAPLMLSNTYHLYLRPGMEVIEQFGGLHQFAQWDKPILTDSGGYQVFSLSRLRKLKNDGVQFRSHLDGSLQFFTPEEVVRIQQVFGSDMIMPLDVCAPYPCKRKAALESIEKTTRWAERSKEYFLAHQNGKPKNYLFGIIQGATFQDLREQSAHEIMKIGFDGYAVGGVSVGEPMEEMFKQLSWVMPLLPENRPRYLMGIGLPDQIVRAVAEGIDMFDTCVPTRFGRHGTAFTFEGRIILRNAEYAKDQRPIDERCHCFVCKKYSRSFLRHLANMGEISGLRLISYHNVHFYINLMKEIREALDNERFEPYMKKFLKDYQTRKGVKD